MEEERAPMEAYDFCFECLQLRIKSDFSDQLVLHYGISPSAFPFGSSAIVEISSTAKAGAGEVLAGQFILAYKPSHEQDCFSKYIDEYSLDNDDCRTSNYIPGESQHNNGFNSCSQRDGISLFDSGRGKACFNHSRRFSCSRTIAALAPIARVGISSYSTFEELAADFMSGSLEDHILDSLSLTIEGKASAGKA